MGLLAIISGFLVFGNREIFYSPAFLVVASLFLLNLSLCTFLQIKLAIGSSGVEKWGSALLHTGLVIIVLGSLIKLTFDFYGIFIVPEGGFFDDRQNDYLFIADKFSNSREYGQFKLFLQEIKIKSGEKGAQFQGLASLIKDGQLVSRQWIRLGQPLSHGLWNYYYSKSGYFVSTTFQDRNGTLEDYLFRLDTYILNDKSEGYKGKFEIKNGKYILSLSYDPKSRSGYVTVSLNGSGNSKRVYSGIVPVGSEVKLPGGEKFSLVNSIPAVIFTAKKEPGLYVVYTGFCITTVGIFILVYRRQKS